MLLVKKDVTVVEVETGEGRAEVPKLGIRRKGGVKET